MSKVTHCLMGRGRMACGRQGEAAHRHVSGGLGAFRAVHTDARCKHCERVLAAILGRAMLQPKGGAA